MTRWTSPGLYQRWGSPRCDPEDRADVEHRRRRLVGRQQLRHPRVVPDPVLDDQLRGREGAGIDSRRLVGMRIGIWIGNDAHDVDVGTADLTGDAAQKFSAAATSMTLLPAAAGRTPAPSTSDAAATPPARASAMQRGARRRRGRCGRTALRCGFTSKSVSENDSHSQNPFPPQHTASGRDAGGCPEWGDSLQGSRKSNDNPETAQGAGVRELGHLVLYVADIGTSAAFYEDALGWRRLTSPPELGTLPIALFLERPHPSRAAAHRSRRSAAPCPGPAPRPLPLRLADRRYRRRPAPDQRPPQRLGGADRGRFGPWRDPQPLRARPHGNEVELYVDVADVDWGDFAAIAGPPRPLTL